MLDSNIAIQYHSNFTNGSQPTAASSRGGVDIPDSQYVSITIKLLFSTLAFAANVVVCRILHKKGKQRTVFDVTIASLTVTDLLTSLCFFVYGIAEAALVMVVRRKALSTSGALLHAILIPGMIGLFFFFLSLFHILLITFQRVYAIYSPIKCRNFMRKTIVKRIIVALWFSAILLFIVELVIPNKTLIFGVAIIFVGATVLVMYAAIVAKIYMLLKRKNFEWKKEHRILLNAVGVTVSFFVCVAPYGYKLAAGKKGKQVLFSLTNINVLLDPLFYYYLSYWLNQRDERRAESRRAFPGEELHKLTYHGSEGDSCERKFREDLRNLRLGSAD